MIRNIIATTICLISLSVFADVKEKSGDHKSYTYTVYLNSSKKIDLNVELTNSISYYENISIDKQCEKDMKYNLDLGFIKPTQILITPVSEDNGIVKTIIGVPYYYSDSSTSGVFMNNNCDLIAHNELPPFVTVEDFEVNKKIEFKLNDNKTLTIIMNKGK